MKGLPSILRFAEEYWVASQCLDYVASLSEEDIEPYSLPDTFGERGITSPKTVLLVFSLELYLKALLEERLSGYPHTHDLSELFDALPKSDRQAMEDLWQDNDWFFREEDLTDIRGNSRDVKGIGEVLFDIRDHFENWRYSFDTEHAEKLAERDMVVPEIFGVPRIIRDYVRSEVSGHLSE